MIKIQKSKIDQSAYQPKEADAFPFLSTNALNSDPLVGITTLTSSPAIRESQSHIIGYGLDIFYTKTNPSGSFDEIPDHFDRNSVQIGMMLLLLGYLGSVYYTRQQNIKKKYE